MMTKEEAMNLVKQVLPCLNIDKKIREAFETLIPELAESEDERIIRLLRELGSLDAAKELYEEFNLSYTDILYWLEKQKEQKPLTTEETELNSIAFLEQMGYTCIPPRKEQKPAEPRKRNKPKESWLSKAKYEIEHADELLIQKQEELREIRELKNQEQKPAEKHDLVAQLKEHLANTPKKQLEAEWKELEKWNDVGPTVEEYLRSIKPAECDEEGRKIMEECEYDKETITQKAYREGQNAGRQEVFDNPGAYGLEKINNVFGFRIGDKVRLVDGDGRFHIIKYFEKIEGLHGPDFYRAVFEDNMASDHIIPGDGFPNGYFTRMEKIDGQKEQNPAEWKSAEWSKNDTVFLKEIIDFFENKTIKLQHDMDMYAHWLKSLPERFNLQPKEEQSKYNGNMDKECIKLCNTLNSIPSIDTFESCCGHLKDSYSVWFFCNDIIAISRLGRCVERNYSDGKWELLVDSTDTHPTGVFWLRSKVPFQSYDEMEESVNELCVCIQYWFNTKFDSYFNDDACK